MARVKIDLFSKRVMYDQLFNLEKPEGVLRFLRCFHELQSRRNEGDLEAAILIIDFLRAWNECKHSDWPLTQREKEIIYLVYSQGLPKSEVAQRLNITLQTLRIHEKKAARKLARLIGGYYERGNDEGATEPDDQKTSRTEEKTGSSRETAPGE